MDVFNWAESPGSSMELRPRVVSVQFGDGYEARADDGLNPVQEVWDVVVDAASVEEADLIDAMLRPGLGRKLFFWTPPRQTVAKTWKCTSFVRTLTNDVREVNLRLRFEQQFQP